jgi:putative hydrolase of the HAD superfamily
VANARITAVWTDFGGVLTPPIGHTMATFCRRTGIDPAALMTAVGKVTARYGVDDPMEPLDTPLVTEAQWLAEVAAVMRADHGPVPELTSLADSWFDGRETNHDWVAALRRIAGKGVFVGLMSNMVPAWDEHWRRMVPVDELFRDVLLSFEIGCRKPQPRIFALAAERAGADPGQCLLVDDLERNCEAAERAGFTAVLFKDAAGALAEVEPLLAAGETA